MGWLDPAPVGPCAMMLEHQDSALVCMCVLEGHHGGISLCLRMKNACIFINSFMMENFTLKLLKMMMTVALIN